MQLSDQQVAGLIKTNQFLEDKSLAEAQKQAVGAKQGLWQYVVEHDLVADDKIGAAVAKELKLPFVALTKTAIPDDVLQVIPEEVARKHKIISFDRDEKGVKVALGNPQRQEALKLLAKKTGQSILPYYATEIDIANTLTLYKKDLQKTFEKYLEEGITAGGDLNEDLPMEKMVDLLLTTAYKEGASDIHIEPGEKKSLVRFRIDGILHDVLVVPKALHDRIVTRLKVLSSLRTDEHHSSQDGKLRLDMREERLDLRISILPLTEGEKVVLRLLSSKSKSFSLVDLGMNENDHKKVMKGYQRAHGMILSTGPTGSGKTTTIYSILKVLNTREKNITTIEDPAEYKVAGANQVQVNTKTNLTFAQGLRSILRQDPDYVFVGEIRDSETATIAVNAAMTGHLVLSTLHTNSAAATFPRLIDMGVEPFLVASTVNVVIGQRLVRKICSECRISYTVTQAELLEHFSAESIEKHYVPVGKNKEMRLYKGEGCKKCHFTGYQGRIGIYEVMDVSKAIRELITAKKDSDIIEKKAVEEGTTLMLDDGLDKISKGMTTIEEVLRVTTTEAE